MNKRSGMRRIVLFLLAAVVFPIAAYAQNSITGTVKDTSGGVLPGVTVEASSDALIEKVRSTVTGENGTYRITNLRPGTYVVTFSLPGFQTIRRDDYALSGDIVATLNMDMRVGALEETVTVTGEAPIVDVQSATQVRVMQKETMDAIPTGRAFQMMGFLIPGMTQTAASSFTGAQDVGGARGTAEVKMAIHGGRPGDQMYYVSGLMNLSGVTSAGGGSGPNIPDMGSLQEVVIGYSAGLGDAQTGGVSFNIVPREGGNSFSGSTFLGYGSEKTQSNNLNDRLRQLGLTAVNGVKVNADINPSIGGPIKRDKVWFFLSFHQIFQENYASGIYYNANVPTPVINYQSGKPSKPNFNPATPEQLNTWTYAPDLTKRGYDPGRHTSITTRFTWQAAQNQKFVGFLEAQRRGNINGLSSLQTPEASTYLIQSPTQLQVNWSSPVTNSFLLEAGGKWVGRDWFQVYLDDPRLIPVSEQTTGLSYRAANTPHRTRRADYGEMIGAKYVTGSHDMKIGFTNYSAWQRQKSFAQPLQYRLNNGVPNQVTQNSLGGVIREIESDYEMGIYAQDRWTMGRMTLSGGLRFDMQDRFYPKQHLGPSVFQPTRNADFPLTPEVSWKDITPRVQAAIDLFGNGRTALKLSAAKYVNRAFVGFSGGGNPIDSLALSATRSWTDNDKDFVVDCDLTNNGAQNLTATGGDICGAVSNARFGELNPESSLDPGAAVGWSIRPYNWEFAVAGQQQLSERLSLNVGVFRRIYGNFSLDDNRAVTGADYSTFSAPIPVDSLLPDSGGTVSNLVMISAAKFGQVDSITMLASNFGKQTEHYNGFDIGLDARLRSGLTLQGGLSSGRVVTDNCEVAAKLPELGVSALTYCHNATSIMHGTQAKFLGSYTIPKWDVLLSGTVQSMPGPSLAANVQIPAATVAASLGRPVPGNPANVTVNVVKPNTLFGDWLNQVDFRVGKVFRTGLFRGAQGRTRLSLDLFNALNTNAVQTSNATYGPAWRRPTAIVGARLLKVSMQFDF